jgi:hypothetical protein
VQLLLNGLLEFCETLHSCSTLPADVHEGIYMVAVQNLKGEIIQLILSRKGGGMYLVSATPTIASRGYHSVRSLTVLVIHSFRIESVTVLFSYDSICTMCFLHQQTISHMLSRMSSLSGRMNIAQVNIGFKKIKQRRISFVLGYLRMIL